MTSVFVLYLVPWIVCSLIQVPVGIIASFFASSIWDAIRYETVLDWNDKLALPHRKGMAEVGVLGIIISSALLIGLNVASSNGLSLPSYWIIPLKFWLCLAIVHFSCIFLVGYRGGTYIGYFLLASGGWLLGMALTIQYLIHEYGASSSYNGLLRILIFFGLTGAAICFAKFLISQKFPSQSSLNQQEQTGKSSDFLGIVASLIGIVSALVGLFPTLLDLGRKLGIIP